MKGKESYYVVLGVLNSATKDEIRQAYLRLAKRFHPDRHQAKSVATQYRNSEKFKVIGEAYFVLGDTSLRRAYDQTLEGDYTWSGEESTTDGVTYYNLFDEDGYPSKLPNRRDRDVILNALIELATSDDISRKKLVDFLDLAQRFGMDLDSENRQENRLNRDFLRAGLFMVGRVPAVEINGLTFHPIVMLDDSLMHGKLCVFTGLVYQKVIGAHDVEGYQEYVRAERNRIWKHFRTPNSIRAAQV
jgi:DnaJ-domain-containing protein 1